MHLDFDGLADAPDGAAVEIEGHVCPPAFGHRHRVFLLAPEPQCCPGCLPRAAGLEVFAQVPVAVGRVRLAGRLRRGGAWGSQLHDARVVAPPLRRRRLLAAAPLVCLAVAAGPIPDAAAVLAGQATVDMHSHAGGLASVRRVREHAPFLPVAGPMRAGRMAASCLAVVSDGPTHHVVDGHIHPYRDPAPGELYGYAQSAFQRVHDLAREQSLRIITDAAGLAAASRSEPGVIVTAEGADFLEGRTDRVDEAYDRWKLRHLQLTHYRVNELGDIQTEPPVHGGLTDAGAAVIRRCNQRGVVVDVAHGTFDLVKRAAAVTSKPLILSHTSLTTAPRPFTRLVTPEHARLVAGTGGVVGIWPPAGIFPDMAALAGGFARMAAVIGTDHVGLGSDMLGLVGASTFESYDQLPELAAALLAAGFSQAETRAMLGGNYERVFRATMVQA